MCVCMCVIDESACVCERERDRGVPGVSLSELCIVITSHMPHLRNSLVVSEAGRACCGRHGRERVCDQCCRSPTTLTQQALI